MTRPGDVMRFISTRNQSSPVSLSRAIAEGLAPDGGLYVPEEFPEFRLERLADLKALPELAERVLRPFFEGDPLQAHLGEICATAFDFPVPLKFLARETAVVELFHGPTAAFKDFGARFLAECFHFIGTGEGRGSARSTPRTVLVATSGDTGSAVAAAFHRRPDAQVVILFPEAGVSERQQKLLTCWDENVRSFAVRGSFDDCQALVKAAFRDMALSEARNLTSANSINIGRLLPQVVYYAAVGSWYLREMGESPGVIVPSGNLGNSVGAFWARRMGFPLRHVGLATNANAVVAEWFGTGRWRPRAAVPTLANAMDVGNPSNIERLRQLYPKLEDLRRVASSISVDDAAIRRAIKEGPSRWGEIWCPHTATAVHFREQQPSKHWILVATAHPAKFDSIVEPLIGRPVEVPAPLQELLSRPSRFEEIDPDLGELRRRLG